MERACASASSGSTAGVANQTFRILANLQSGEDLEWRRRRRRAAKRDGGSPVTLSDTNIGDPDQAYDALDVDDLLTELERYDAQAAEIVGLRVFGGLTIPEVAESMALSVATVNRRWAAGKVWLMRELSR